MQKLDHLCGHFQCGSIPTVRAFFNLCGQFQCGSIPTVRAVSVRAFFNLCGRCAGTFSAARCQCGSRCAGDTCAALDSKNRFVRLDSF